MFVLEIIFQFFVDFLLEIVAEIMAELAIRKFSNERLTHSVNAVGAVILYLGVGIIIGWLSIIFFPHSFVRGSKLHGISLVITPLLAGLAMSGIGWLRQRQGQQIIRIDTFGYAFVFAFGIALIRFLFTT